MPLIQKPLKDKPRGMKRFRARFICYALSFHLDLPMCIYVGCSIRYFFAGPVFIIACFHFIL